MTVLKGVLVARMEIHAKNAILLLILFRRMEFVFVRKEPFYTTICVFHVQKDAFLVRILKTVTNVTRQRAFNFTTEFANVHRDFMTILESAKLVEKLV